MKTSLKELMSRKMSHIIATTLMVCLLLGVNTMKVNAYYGNVSNLKQTQATKTSATIQWTGDTDVAKYNIYIGTDYYGPKTLVASTKATSYTLSNLASATEYNVKVEAISATNEVGNSNSKYIVTLPDKVTKVKQERWYYFLRSLDVTWKDLPTADGYEVRLYNSKGKIVKTNKVSYNSTSFSKMKDEVYTVSVRAHMTFNGKKYYSSWSQKIYCMNQPRIKTVKVSSKKLKVTWAKVSGVTGYDVYVSTKKTSGYKKVKSVGKNTTKATITKFSKKKFSAKKTYYVYVVAKKKVKGRNNISSSLYYWNSKTGGYSYK